MENSDGNSDFDADNITDNSGQEIGWQQMSGASLKLIVKPYTALYWCILHFEVPRSWPRVCLVKTCAHSANLRKSLRTELNIFARHLFLSFLSRVNFPLALTNHTSLHC